MKPQHLTGSALFLAVALIGAGTALAQGQTCIHRTADGRCLHWVPAVTNQNPASLQPLQPSWGNSPGGWAAPAPTAGCFYDPGSRTLRQCYHITADGRCVHFGGPCN